MPANNSASPKSRRIFCTQDAMRIAKRRQPKVIFDYITGASGREVGTARNQNRFDEITLQPRVMTNVSNRNMAHKILGQTYDLPFGIAPMGMCNLSWPNADRALAQAAVDYNIPVCLSTAASSSLEDMREQAGENVWFQLYVGGSVEDALELVKRAQNAGYKNLILTVDVPQVARRIRDDRNGFAMPLRIGPRMFWDFATHPRWSLTSLWHGAPSPRNFDHTKGFDRHASRAGADWGFLDRLRDNWNGNLIVKGITSAQDARRVASAGADAVYVSNHGGRQLDSAPAAIDILPKIRNAVGAQFPLLFDSGVRNGEDIVKALALGADFVMIGRPLLYALGADGARGLNTLIQILATDASLTLAQTGLDNIASVSSQILADRPLIKNAPEHPRLAATVG